MKNGKFLVGAPGKMTYSKAKETCSKMGFQIALAESFFENTKAQITEQNNFVDEIFIFDFIDPFQRLLSLLHFIRSG